jgi:hypothetical protein
MKRVICFLMLAVMVLVTAPVWAYDLNNHTTLAPNGKGDAMIFPFYLAGAGGWQTKLTVINTSPSLSAVAKVVLRSFIYSTEVLDFFIYLSPTDVWTGVIEVGPNGPRLISTDDSIYGPGGFGSAESPVTALISPACVEGENGFGYVEVFEAWATSLGLPAVPKATIRTAWDANTGPFPTENILAGYMEFGNAVAGISAALPATVLKDQDAVAKLLLGKETFLGGVSQFNNSSCEVEAVLSKDYIAMPYYNGETKFSFHIFNFPTKYSQALSEGVCGDCSESLSPYFDFLCGAAEYGPRYFDLTEQSPSTPSSYFSPVPPGERYEFPYEVNLVGIPAEILFEEGWVDYAFVKPLTTCSTLDDIENADDEIPTSLAYTGAPVLPVVVNFDALGWTMMYGAYDYGQVTYDGLDAVDYQVSDSVPAPES